MQYTFDETGMRRAVTAIRKTENTPITPAVFESYMAQGQSIKWKFGYNASGETIPAFSVVAIETGSTINGIYHANLTKPSSTFRRLYGITGPLPILAASRGGYHTESWLCTYDTGTPAADEEWGPKPGQWTLAKGYPGMFTVEGIFDSTNKYVIGERHPINAIFGRAQGAIAKDSTTGVVEVYSGAPTSGASIITSMTITGVHNPWVEIADNAFLGVNWRNGYPVVDAVECS